MSKQHHIEAYCTMPSYLIRWGWQCLACGASSEAHWDNPHDAIAAGDAAHGEVS